MREWADRIFGYQRASDFLGAYYSHRKQVTARWSYEGWARRLGQKKAQLIRMVKGKSPVGEAAEKAFLRYFQFSREQSHFFSLLVAHEKIAKMYPGIRLELPALSEAKIAQLKFTQAEPNSPHAALLARPEIGWLVTLCGGHGLKASCAPQIQSHLPSGLKKINIAHFLKIALEAGILQKQGESLRFVPGAEPYLDSRITGIQVAIDRYRTILASLADQVEEAAQRGRGPLFNNLAVNLRLHPEDLPKLLLHVRKHQRETLALFSREDGNLVVDLETFLAPVAHREGGFDFDQLCWDIESAGTPY